MKPHSEFCVEFSTTTTTKEKYDYTSTFCGRPREILAEWDIFERFLFSLIFEFWFWRNPPNQLLKKISAQPELFSSWNYSFKIIVFRYYCYFELITWFTNLHTIMILLLVVCFSFGSQLIYNMFRSISRWIFIRSNTCFRCVCVCVSYTIHRFEIIMCKSQHYFLLLLYNTISHCID